MNRQPRKAQHPSCADTTFPDKLGRWYDKYGSLVDALLAVRRLGVEGREAAQAMLAIRGVAVLRDSWALWETLVEGDGQDPDVLLFKAVSPLVVEDVRRALWGARWDEPLVPRHLQLVPDTDDC